MNILPVIAVLGVAVAVAGCDQGIEIHSPGTIATTASAPAAPSLADQPIDPTPATHAGEPQPAPSAAAPPSAAAAQPTARDTSANAPAETLTPRKEAAEMPLAGQVNNHSSPAFEKREGGK